MEKASAKLIQAFLELKHRIRLDNRWANEVNEATSLAILYQQFRALCAQIGLPVSQLWPAEAVRFFENDFFLTERPIEKYAAVLAELEAYEPALGDCIFWPKAAYKSRQLTSLFSGLLHFKLATDFRYFGALEGLEVGGAYAHSLKTSAFNKEAVDKIDQLLAGLIDPERIVLDLAVLTKKFKYPTADYESKYLQERLDEELGN